MANAPDPRRFIRLHAEVSRLVASLPAAPRRRAQRILDAAERAQDPSGLVEALEVVESSGP